MKDQPAALAQDQKNPAGGSRKQMDRSGAPAQKTPASGSRSVMDRSGVLAQLLEAQLAAARAGDEEAARVLHEAVGRLLGGRKDDL